MITPEAVRRIWTEVLEIPEGGRLDDFYAAGGDSLLAVRMVGALRDGGLQVTLRDFLRRPTLSYLVALADQPASELPPRFDTAPGIEAPGAPYRVLPAQQRWLDHNWAEPTHFNLGAIFSVGAACGLGEVAAAGTQLVHRHAALRTAYRRGVVGWVAETLPPDACDVVSVIDPGSGPLDAAVGEAQVTLDPYEGRVARVLVGRADDGDLLLALVAHHLTLDGYSLSLAGDDIERLLGGAVGPVNQPEHYAAACDQWEMSAEAQEDCGAWAAPPWGVAGRVTPTAGGAGNLDTVRTTNVALSPEHTVALARRCRQASTTVADATLQGLCEAIAGEWSLEAVIVDEYSHGRDVTPGGIDIAATVGYLQSTYPVLVRCGRGPGTLERGAAAHIGVPERRFGFDILRQRRGGTAVGPAPGTVDIRYNFRGQLGRINERRNRIVRGADIQIRGQRSRLQSEPYELMLEGDLIDGRLVLGIKSSVVRHEPARIEDVLRRAAAALSQEAR